MPLHVLLCLRRTILLCNRSPAITLRRLKCKERKDDEMQAKSLVPHGQTIEYLTMLYMNRLQLLHQPWPVLDTQDCSYIYTQTHAAVPASEPFCGDGAVVSGGEGTQMV